MPYNRHQETTFFNQDSAMNWPTSRQSIEGFLPELDSGGTPQSCKLGIIHAIYKNGDRSNPLNYRPVTLLPVLPKVMETVVAEELMNHLENHGHIFSSQHGF